MAFTQDYIALCYKYRSIYNDKSPKTGDWYGNMTTSQLKLMTAESRTGFNNPEWFYIPDLDDLFELLTYQIKSCQGKEVPAELIELVFDPSTNWSVQVKLETGIIFKS